MSLLSQLYDKVVSLTGRLNQIEENAKTNDEFPTQSELVLSSKIRVSNGGVTEVISVEDIILKAVATSQPYLNRFIETTGISSTGLGISINPNWIWMINGIRYSNPVENSFVNYYAATGFQRIDIIVATENVDFQLIHGIEAEEGVETPVAPVLPINALLVTTILVGDDSMDSPTLPESGYDFLISTDSDNAIVLGSDGKLWSGGGSGGSVPDATTTVKGKIKLAGDLGGTADAPTVPVLADKVDKVLGKSLSTNDFTDIDKSKLDGIASGATNFTVANVLATVLSGLSLSTGGAIVSTDTVLVAFGKIQKQINDLSSSLSSYVQTSRTINSKPLTSDVILTAADIGYNQVILTSSTTAQASWNGKVVKVRGNITITIPASGLPTGYTFEFMVDPTYTLTWAIVTKTWVFGTPSTNGPGTMGTILQDEQDDTKIYLMT